MSTSGRPGSGLPPRSAARADSHRPSEVIAQPVAAPVPEASGGELTPGDAGRGLAEKCVAAMGDGPQPRAAVDGPPVVVVVSKLGLTDVDAGSDTDSHAEDVALLVMPMFHANSLYFSSPLPTSARPASSTTTTVSTPRTC